MPNLLVRVFSISTEEGRELEALLSSSEGVEGVSVHDSRNDIVPGVMYATALHFTFLLSIASGAAAGIAGGMTKEIGKDIYTAAKEHIGEKIQAWKESKGDDSRERIQFQMLEDGELVNRRYPRGRTGR